MTLHVDIRKKLGDFQLEVAFDAGAEPLALLGASGCGKSMTLKCIAGIMTPDRGRIVLNGRVLFDSEARIDLPPQQRRVGYLFQNYALFPTMTVEKNILCGIRSGSKAEKAAALSATLHRFRLEGLEKRYPAQLSGGQQQRVALARILCSQPEVILLDEPFSALDSYLKWDLELKLSDFLENFSGPILWVSHDRGEVFRNCKRVCVLDQGASQGTFTLRQLFHEPETEAAARLSGCKNIVEAVPAGSAVTLPAWGLTLSCGKPVPADVRQAGIRARHVMTVPEGTPDAFYCTVERVIQDVFTTIVLLRPEGAASGAPLLRMELERDDWRRLNRPGRDPGGHPCRVRPADPRHPGGHALCLHADHQPGHAVPGAGGHPERDLDPKPPRLPQGGSGESGGGAARHQSRSGNALRPPRRLRQADGLT